MSQDNLHVSEVEDESTNPFGENMKSGLVKAKSNVKEY
jgi:hypothetical protein